MPLSFIVAWIPGSRIRVLPRLARPPARITSLLAGVASITWVVTGASLAHADGLAGATLAQKGNRGTPACMTCHGAQGEGQAAAGFPRLAGQSQAYLLKQLQAFAGGERKNPVMAPIARSLSAAQMRDAADYYAGLPGWKQAGAPHTPSAQYAQGLKIATEGDWTKEMPACFACHGIAGEGVPPHFPALAGQPMAYTQTQLNAWRAAQRTNDPLGLMQAVAEKMSDAEIAAVSRYLENPSRPGKEK